MTPVSLLVLAGGFEGIQYLLEVVFTPSLHCEDILLPHTPPWVAQELTPRQERSCKKKLLRKTSWDS